MSRDTPSFPGGGEDGHPFGFLGIGVMGTPMALNLRKAGAPLIVWTRSAEKAEPLRQAGAEVAGKSAEVFERARVVFAMLADGPALDAATGRGSPSFASRMRGRTLVNMATVSPGYSRGLEAEVRRVGGSYIEAPVSGSRKPAEAGQLVAMVAGEPDAVARVVPLLKPMCRAVMPCGSVPGALAMKIAVNVFLIASVTGLVEAVHVAQRLGVDMGTFYDIVDESQMASGISKTKVAKLRVDDLSPQAAISNVLDSTRLASEAARAAGAAAPLIEACLSLYRDASAAGLDGADMIAVLQAFQGRSQAA